VTLGFEQARECVLREVGPLGAIESVPAPECTGRVLAEPILSDRDYPPFPRSARDGYAVRTSDIPGSLRIIGEVRAGELFDRAIGWARPSRS
jgi:molybdopterin molybdotransferase